MSDETPPEWLNDLPEPLRNAPFIAKAKDAEEAVGKLAHAAKLVGTSIRIPAEDASDEDKAAFYAKLAEVPGVAQLPTSDDTDGLNALLGKLGKPEDVAGYKLPEVAEFQWDDKIADDLRSYALEAGLTDSQFKTFATKIAQQELDASTSAQESLNAARQALRNDWGETLEERESLIRGWMEKSNAPESLRDLLNDRSLDIETMNWLHETAKQFKGEVNPVRRDGTSNEPLMTPAEAQEQIPKIIGDLLQIRETDPRYKNLQQKLVMLQGIASSNQAA